MALEIEVSEQLLNYGFDQQTIQRHVNEWLVLTLFTETRISSGKAAQLLGISRYEFLTLLNSRGISYVDYSPEEITDELNGLKDIPTIPE